MVPESRERVDVGVVEVGAVVDGGEAELGGEPDAGARAELVGVEAAPQTCGRSGREDGARLVGVEGAGSQNTSIQRAYGAAASSIGPVTRST